MDAEILYSDGLVTISPDTVIFHNYYFPIFTDKRVSTHDIESIEVKEPTVWNGKWRFWGTGNFWIWFPLDMNRASRDCIFHVNLRNKTFKIGFTVEDSTRVEEIFLQMGLIR